MDAAQATSEGGRSAPRPATADDVGCSDRDRFELELEFVQLLANSEYLNWLAQNRYFEDQAFINYLSYLQYWKRKDYVHFITFPHCLRMLELLQQPEFRKVLVRKDMQNAIAWQQHYFHTHFRKNRVREALQASLSAQSAGARGTSVGGAGAGADVEMVADSAGVGATGASDLLLKTAAAHQHPGHPLPGAPGADEEPARMDES